MTGRHNNKYGLKKKERMSSPNASVGLTELTFLLVGESSSTLPLMSALKNDGLHCNSYESNENFISRWISIDGKRISINLSYVRIEQLPYIRHKVSGVILMYEVCSAYTLYIPLSSWISNTESYQQNVDVLLLGNTRPSTSKRQMKSVNFENAVNIALDNGWAHMEANVDDPKAIIKAIDNFTITVLKNMADKPESTNYDKREAYHCPLADYLAECRIDRSDFRLNSCIIGENASVNKFISKLDCDNLLIRNLSGCVTKEFTFDGKTISMSLNVESLFQRGYSENCLMIYNAWSENSLRSIIQCLQNNHASNLLLVGNAPQHRMNDPMTRTVLREGETKALEYGWTHIEVDILDASADLEVIRELTRMILDKHTSSERQAFYNSRHNGNGGAGGIHSPPNLPPSVVSRPQPPQPAPRKSLPQNLMPSQFKSKPQIPPKNIKQQPRNIDGQVESPYDQTGIIKRQSSTEKKEQTAANSPYALMISQLKSHQQAPSRNVNEPSRNVQEQIGTTSNGLRNLHKG